MKWDTKRVALAGGSVWGVLMFLTTIAAATTGYGMTFLQVMTSIYPWYSITFAGSVVGLIYGFLDVFIGVYIVVWVYKQLGKK